MSVPRFQIKVGASKFYIPDIFKLELVTCVSFPVWARAEAATGMWGGGARISGAPRNTAFVPHNAVLLFPMSPLKKELLTDLQF